MTWKEVWNMIVHSREIWPEPTTFHEFVCSHMFLYFFFVVAFLGMIAYFQFESWMYARKTAREEREYQRQQEKMKWQKIAEEYYHNR